MNAEMIKAAFDVKSIAAIFKPIIKEYVSL